MKTLAALGLAALFGCATGSSSVKTQDSLTGGSHDSGETLSEKYDRLEQLDSHFVGEGSILVRGYAMWEGTELELRLVMGIRAGTVQVITDGEKNFLSEGQTYHSEAYNSMTDITLGEMDVNGDKIITSNEAASVSQRVQRQYAQTVGKDEFKRRVCENRRRNELSNCEFEQASAEGECRFNYVAEKGHINFDRHSEESDCRFDSFRNHSGVESCLNAVASKYDQKERQMEAAHTVCIEKIEKDIANCKFLAEKAYGKCLNAK